VILLVINTCDYYNLLKDVMQIANEILLFLLVIGFGNQALFATLAVTVISISIFF